MAELFFLRHGQRIDHARKEDPSAEPIFPDFEPYDPSLATTATSQIQEAAQNMIDLTQIFPSEGSGRKNIYIHFSPYLRCVQTADILMSDLKPKLAAKFPKYKLRFQLLGDFALSEWIHENMSDKPPFVDSNDAYHMFTPNVKLMKNRSACSNFRPTNTLGQFNGPDLSFKEYQTNIKEYFIKLLATYNKPAPLKNKDMIIIVSHGYAINSFMSYFVNHPIFNEIPECKVNYARRVKHDDNSILANEEAENSDQYVWRLFQNALNEEVECDLNLKTDIVYYKTNFIKKDELGTVKNQTNTAWQPSDFDAPRMSFKIETDRPDINSTTSAPEFSQQNGTQLGNSNLPSLRPMKTFVCAAAKNWEPGEKQYPLPSHFELKSMNAESFRENYSILNHPSRRISPEVSPSSQATRNNSVIDLSKLMDNNEIYKPIKLKYSATSEISIHKLNQKVNSQINLAQAQRQSATSSNASSANSSVVDFSKFVNSVQDGNTKASNVEVVHDDPDSYFPSGVKIKNNHFNSPISAAAAGSNNNAGIISHNSSPSQSLSELNSIAEQSGYTPSTEKPPSFLGNTAKRSTSLKHKMHPSAVGSLSLLAKIQSRKRDETESEVSESESTDSSKIFSLNFPTKKASDSPISLSRKNRPRGNSVKLIPSVLGNQSKKGIFYNLDSDDSSSESENSKQSEEDEDDYDDENNHDNDDDDDDDEINNNNNNTNKTTNNNINDDDNDTNNSTNNNDNNNNNNNKEVGNGKIGNFGNFKEESPQSEDKSSDSSPDELGKDGTKVKEDYIWFGQNRI